VKLGSVSLDGTKIKANASKHKALSWDYANRLEAQERFERERAEYEEKQAKREARAKQTGKKPWGKQPKPPTAGPRGKDQVSLTDSESRIMPTSGGGFEQAYNAQVGVDTDTHLIVEQHVTQHSNDKQEIEPALAAIGDLPAALGEAKKLLADTGYFSAANVKKCLEDGIEPFIAQQRQQHNVPLAERFAEDLELPPNATPVQAMQHRLQTQEGKAVYAKRKATVEMVFGIVKEVLGFW
jgi:IS5 family transposase